MFLQGLPLQKYGTVYDHDLFVPDPGDAQGRNRRWGHVFYPPTGETFHVDEPTYTAVCQAHPYTDGPVPYKPAALAMDAANRQIKDLAERAALAAARGEITLPSTAADTAGSPAAPDDPETADLRDQLAQAVAVIEQQSDAIAQLSEQVKTKKAAKKPSPEPDAPEAPAPVAPETTAPNA